jgi:hypothetical protein
LQPKSQPVSGTPGDECLNEIGIAGRDEETCRLRAYAHRIRSFVDRSIAGSRDARAATTEESLVGGVASLLSGLLRSGDAQRAPELAPQLLTFLRGPFLTV